PTIGLSSTSPLPWPAGQVVASPLPSVPGAHEPALADEPATYEPTGRVAGSVTANDVDVVAPSTAETLLSQVPLSPVTGALSAMCRPTLVGWAAAVVACVGADASEVARSKV